MSDLRFSFPACIVAGKGQITPDDVGFMQRQMWPEGICTRQQAAMAIALDECCTVRCPEWSAFLVEAIADFVVWKQPTPGIVPGETAGWLLERLSHEGAVRSQTGLDILMRVLNVAHDVPNFLSVVILNQVRLALLPEPRGAYAGRRKGRRAVMKPDLAFLWRVMRSGLERGRSELSRGELLTLQAIDDLALPAEHHPGWRQLMALTTQVERSSGTDARDHRPRIDEDENVAAA